jgi:uncharacterized membrane protein YhiD involved in acid resistance
MMPDGIVEIAAQLLAAGIMGGLIGFERRVHHKAIGIAGMVMIAIGSTTYMLLARIIHERHHLVCISAETLGFCRSAGANPVGVG